MEPAILVLNDGDSASSSVALSVNPEQISEDDAATTVTVTAELDQGARKEATAVTVSVGSANDSAASGADYAAVSEFVVTIPAGSRRGSESFTLTPIDDQIAEDAERITVHGVFGGLLVEPAELVLNDDGDSPPSSVVLLLDPVAISEEGGAHEVALTAQLFGGMLGKDTSVSIRFGATGDAAVSGVDYRAIVDSLVVIPAGEESATTVVRVMPNNDDIAEGPERITVHGVSRGLPVEPAILVLNDGDSASSSVALSVNPEQISEDDAATTVTVTAELDQGARKEATAVTVSVGSANDSAASGADYAAVSEFVVTIPAGSRRGSESFTLTPIDDQIAEDAERITVHGVFGGLLVEPAELVLNDDGDSPPSSVVLLLDPVAISEEGGAHEVALTAQLFGGMLGKDTSVSIRFGATGDAAVSGVDYRAVGDSLLVIPAGEESATTVVRVMPNNDDIAEGPEQITVDGRSRGLTVEPATLVLNDDDLASSAVALSVNPEQISEDDAVTTVTVTAELDQGAGNEATVVTVSVGSANDAAASSVDYAAVSDFVVTIPAGSRRGSGSFTLTPIDDRIFEGVEQITVHGRSEGLTVEPAELVLNDGDSPSSSVKLSVNPEQISEDDAATTVTVTAKLDQGARKEATAVTVSVGSANDAAASSVDYAAVSDFVVTIPAGSRRGSESFTLTPIDDRISEGAEQITVHGRSEGLTVEPAELVLNDGDSPSSSVALSVNPEQISEDDAATTVTVTAKLDQGARNEATVVTVSVGSANDAAASSVDYAAVSDFVVTIPAGSRRGSESFTLTPIDDEIAEDAERITVHGVFGGLLVEPAELVLNDDGDSPPSSVVLLLDPVAISEEGGAHEVALTAQLFGGMLGKDTSVSIRFGATGDAAVSGVDYRAVGDSLLVIPAGEESATTVVRVMPNNDDIAEGPEQITVDGRSRGLTVEPATLVLNDDDLASSAVALSVNPEQISEDDAATTVTVTAKLDQGARNEATAVTVSVGSANDAAASSVDYAAVSDFVVTIPAGSRRGSESFTLTPIDDRIFEGAEQITVHGRSEGLTVEPAELVLNDGDSPSSSVALSVNPEQISEDDAATTVTVTAKLDQGARKEATAVTVSVGGAADSAASGGDYAAVSDFVVTIPAGSRRGSESFTLTPIDDRISEGAEQITVHGRSRGLTVEPAELVLNDGDSPSSSVALSVNPEQISEDDAATTVTVTAKLDQGARKEATAVTVSVGGAADSAASGGDYAAVSDFVVTIPAGSRRGSESFTLIPIDDRIFEGAEQITVHGRSRGLTVEPAELVLNDGDSPSSSVALSVNPGQISEDDAATTVTVTAKLDQGARNEATVVTVSVGSANDSAASGGDYAAVSDFVVTIPARSRRGSGSFTLTPIDDRTFEGAEQITVHGRSRGLTVEPAELVLNDGDSASSSVALSVNPEQISEDDAATTVTVTAELDQGARKEATAVTVSVGGAADSAASGGDYAAVSDFVVTILAGSRRGSESFTLIPIDDRIFEGAEQITVHGRSRGLTVEPAELVLNDGDSPSSSVALSVNPEQISEDDAATTVTVTAKLDQGARNEATVVTVSVGSANDSAASGGDYAAVSDFVVTIPARSRRGSGSFTLTPIDDRTFEGAEQITVHGRSRGLTVEPAELVLNDGDSPSSSVALSVNPEQISEDDAATTVTVTAKLDQGARKEATAVTVSVGGAADSAASGGDYAAVSDFVVTIPAGSRRGSESFTLIPIDDRIFEGAEQITVHGRSRGLTVEPAELVLNDGDSPSSSVALSVNPGQISEDDAATIVTVTAKLDQGARNEATVVTVSVGSANDSAASGGDYAAVSDFVVTIPARSRRGSGSFTLTPIDDQIAEDAERITVHGTASGFAVEPATLRLTDDDGDIEPPVVPTEIRILDSRAREGAGIMRFSVRLDKAPSASIAVDWGTQPLAFGPKSADEDVDYLGAFGTLVIPSGQTSGRITVHLRDDLLDEFDERFRVVLFGASAGEIADDIAVGTIMDDDEPELRIADEHASESAGWLEFAVSLSAPSVQVIEGRIATSDVTATAGQDYEPVEAVFQIRPGRQIHTVRVRVSNDSLDEDDETFVLAVTNVRNAVVADGEAEGTIEDDDGDIEPPVVPTEIRILDSRAREGAGIMRFSVRLDKAPSASIAVDWGTQPLAFGPKSADEDVDYLGAFGTLVIPSGQTSGRITVHLRDDLLDEFDERFRVVLFGASAGEIADDIAVGTIMDDDEPELRIADEHASESAGWLEFAVSLSAPSVQVIEGRIATSDVTATAGQDYEPVEAVFQIRPGRQIHTVRVRVSNDSLDEDDETFVLAVTNVRNAVVADGEAEGTIEDDDALPTLHTADESAAEDNGELAFQVWLNVRSSRSVRVDYRTSELTAGDGEDFEGASGTIEFLPGELSKRIAVRLLDDELDEADETFELALSAPANAIVEVPRAVGTIEDDDVEPSLRMEDARASENAGTIGFSATLEAVAGRDLRYSYWTTDAEALAGEDYEGRRAEFVIPAGATTAILAVPLVDDAFDEAEETFLVSLNNPREAGIGTITCIGTIEDDDRNERAARMWITRFGRSVATQVMESVEDRMDDGSRGSRLSLGLDPMPTLFQVAPRDTLGQSWSDVRERANGLFGLNGRELLERGAFLVQPGADSGQQPRGWAFWGRGATLRFAGEEDGISVNGDVFTTTVGMDYRRGRTLAGFALSNSLGTGGFEVAGSEHNGSPRDGVADSRISILSPYVSVPLGERVSVWGLGGYGIGTMSLAAEDGKSDLSMRLGAIGARGNLWPGMGGSRLQLALKADMFWTRVDAGATAVRPASMGLVSRGRVLAEGSWRLGSLWGGEITPILEAGLRYDAGDAETGLGLEVGSGFRYRHPTRGLSVELTGRTLAVHQDKAYREWGIGGTVRIDPGDDRRGLSLSLASSHGQALSGVNRLWNGRSPLVPGTQFAAGGSARLEGEVGYGFGGFAIGSLTPYAGVALQEDASRAFRLGSRLQLGSSLQLSVEGSRRLGSFTGPDHAFVIRGHLR